MYCKSAVKITFCQNPFCKKVLNFFFSILRCTLFVHAKYHLSWLWRQVFGTRQLTTWDMEILTRSSNIYFFNGTYKYIKKKNHQKFRFSSKYWKGMWMVWFCFSTTKWPLLGELPITITVSPFFKMISDAELSSEKKRIF